MCRETCPPFLCEQKSGIILALARAELHKKEEGVSKWRMCASRRIENRRRQILQIYPKSFILCISTFIC